MRIKERFEVSLCSRKEVRDFIEYWHYSRNINGLRSDYCFKLIDKKSGDMVGACIYGKMAMANQYKKYGDSEDDVIELRRFVTTDDTPMNTESFFIGKTLRFLSKNTSIKTVVSYADPYYGHKGIIYKATNFSYVGDTSPGRMIVYRDRLYHDKSIRSKYKGKLKPFALRLKRALKEGEAYYTKTPGKLIYVFDLSKHKSRS